MNDKALGQLIDDYQLQNGTNIITEEELLDIIPESKLYPNYYFFDECMYTILSDYDYYLLKNGYDPITGEFNKSWEMEQFSMEDIDELIPYEVASEFCECPSNIPFDEALQISAYLDVLIIPESDYYEDLIDDEPSLEEGEWKSDLADEYEYYSTLRSKTVEVTAHSDDILIKLLYGKLNPTTFCLKIQWRVNDLAFLIEIIDHEQFYWYRVYVDTKNQKGKKRAKFLGRDLRPDSVLEIINYYLETGTTIEYYQ